MTSIEASGLWPKKFFPNGYFDFIYIDADHSYNGVREDIKVWTPLVKEGGLIGGHDYGRVRWPGVKLAVDEKFGEENVILYEKQSIWLVEL
jgi:predicted O-methyltransferase YrrM